MSTLDAQTESVIPEPPAVVDDLAAGRVAELLELAHIDALLADAEATGIGIDGPDGLIGRMIKAVLERAQIIDRAGPPTGRALHARVPKCRFYLDAGTTAPLSQIVRIRCVRPVSRWRRRYALTGWPLYRTPPKPS